MHGLFNDYFEYRREVAGRRADDLKDFGTGDLLSERLGKFGLMLRESALQFRHRGVSLGEPALQFRILAL